jgi:hypothetical protein
LAKTVRILEQHIAVAISSVGATETDISTAGSYLDTSIVSQKTPLERHV